MALITEYCRRGECELCAKAGSPACEHFCHTAPAVEIGPEGLRIIGADCDSAPVPDPLIPRPKGRR